MKLIMEFNRFKTMSLAHMVDKKLDIGKSIHTTDKSLRVLNMLLDMLNELNPDKEYESIEQDDNYQITRTK